MTRPAMTAPAALSDEADLLRALQERQLTTGGDPQAPASARLTPPRTLARPWYVTFLLGASGWVAGGFLLGFVGLLFRPDSTLAAALAGAVLLAAAWGLFRADRDGAFVAQLALALSIAGQFMVLYALVGRGRPEPVVVAACATLLQVAIVLAMPNALQRTLSTLFAAIGWAITLNLLLFDAPRLLSAAETTPPTTLRALLGWSLAWLPVGAALHALVRTEPAWVAQGRAPLLRPVLVGLIVALAFATPASQPFASAFHGAAGAASAGTAVLPLLSAAAALFAGAAAFATRHRGLLGACTLATLSHVSWFYYALGVSLLTKSLLMLASGAALLYASRALDTTTGSATTAAGAPP